MPLPTCCAQELFPIEGVRVNLPAPHQIPVFLKISIFDGLPEITNAFKSWKPELFMNTPMKAAYDAIAPDKTKWTKFIGQMIAFAQEPFDFGDENISKISAPVLIIAGDNDGLDKIELAKTYKLLGGGVSSDLAPMPKSQLAIVPSQGHVSLMMQTTTVLTYLNNF